MKGAEIIIVLLSNQGYWFGGQAGTATIEWSMRNPPTEAVLVWSLAAGEVRLADGKVAMPVNDRPATVTIELPEVRARTAFRWAYHVLEREGGKELAAGETAIRAFPRGLLNGLGERLAGKRIVVADVPEGLPGVLSASKVAFERVKRVDELQFSLASIVLVGADQIEGSLFAETMLQGQAQTGASVMIFRQTQLATLAGYRVARRAATTSIEWNGRHALLRTLQAEDLASWLSPSGADLYAIQLPADEPALEIGYWPREVAGERPVPIDALLVAKSVGAGRIVVCQVPLGDWRTDPRSQVFIANALDYLASRPEVTPPSSRRRTEPPRVIEMLPSIGIPAGAKP
jgi:hypothetical protein